MMAELESRLARVLGAGTWIASGVIAIGLALGGLRVATAGLVLFILLPVGRLTLMLIAYLRQRDYRLSAITGVVLFFIALGFVVGLRIP
jgi:uncharacterized membrane protein